jgi:hypothetical protein
MQEERTVGSAKESRERMGNSRVILATTSRQGVAGMQEVCTLVKGGWGLFKKFGVEWLSAGMRREV